MAKTVILSPLATPFVINDVTPVSPLPLETRKKVAILRHSGGNEPYFSVSPRNWGDIGVTRVTDVPCERLVKRND